MKIVIAPDAFKESLSAMQVAMAIEEGIRRVLPDAECVKIPMADGGEGTVAALVAATQGRMVRKRVCGPCGDPVAARYGISGDGRTAVIEMAAASGLPLVMAAKRNPAKTTTYGTGELIVAALERNVGRIILGLGGSATNDGGAGMAQALGIVFYDHRGRAISERLTGGALRKISSINLTGRDARLAGIELLVACDVDNPLTGRRGASMVFGPQKGATARQVNRLDRNLRHYGRIVEATTGIAILQLPGAGAAGGLAATAVALAGGELRSGVDVVMEAVGFESALAGADIVITGEGRIDSQTVHGKVPAGVARAAKRQGVAVVGVGGGLADDARRVFAYGIDALESAIAKEMSLAEAIGRSRRNLRDAGERVARWLVLGSRLHRR